VIIMVLEIILIVLVVIVILAGLWIVGTYNGLITLRTRIDNAWAQIEVFLKRRYDLIPNLVETVKGYAKHEKETLENVMKARAGLMTGSTEDRMQANNMLSQTLKSLFAVTEAYPNLKANENFLELQRELSSTENGIASVRSQYNNTVEPYNRTIQQFPSNIIAGMFGFLARPWFEAPAAEREAPKVKF